MAESVKIAAMADTYAQAGDQAGLKQFYLDKIALFRNAPLSAEDRKTRIAAMRRGLIPALTRLKDYPGAVDQYIELINIYPEDEGWVSEAALYASISLNGLWSRSSIFATSAPRYDTSRISLAGQPPRL